MNNLNKISLSQDTISIILGSILGNGSLKFYPNDLNARLNITHSIKQQSYFNYKVSALSQINRYNYVLQSISKHNKNTQLNYISDSLPELTEIHNLTYKKNHINILRKWTNQLTPLALCVWWLDVGSIFNGKQGVFCTDGYDLNSIKILKRTLEINWDIKTSINIVNKSYQDKVKQYYRIAIDFENLEKFFKIILPYIPIEDMLYKGILIFKDKELQQRWISVTRSLIKSELREKLNQIERELIEQRMI